MSPTNLNKTRQKFILQLFLVTCLPCYVYSHDDCKSLEYIGDPCNNGTSRYMCYNSTPICSRCARGQHWNPEEKECRNCEGNFTSCEANVLTSACSQWKCKDDHLSQNEEEEQVFTQSNQFSTEETMTKASSDFDALSATVKSVTNATETRHDTAPVTKENTTGSFVPSSNNSNVTISINGTENESLKVDTKAEISIPLWTIILPVVIVLMILICAIAYCLKRRKGKRESEKNVPERQNLNPKARREPDDQCDGNQPINPA